MAETGDGPMSCLGSLGRGDEDQEVDRRWRVGGDEGVVGWMIYDGAGGSSSYRKWQ